MEGNYTVSNMLSSSEGPFNITLINVTAIATIDLASNEDGKLYSNHSVLDMAYKSLEVSLINWFWLLGFRREETTKSAY